MEMQTVTLKAEVRLILFQKVISYRPMGIMTSGTVLHHRGMFEGKRTLLVCMALETELVLSLVRPQEWLHHGTVGIMALRAGHLPLFNRMMIRIVRFSHDVLVAGETEFALRLLQKRILHMLVPVAQLIPGSHFVLRSMDGVTLDTGNIIQGVLRTPPIHGVTISVTPSTDGRSLNCIQLAGIQDIRGILLLDMLAGRTMTGLTAPRFHAGFNLKACYLTVNGVLKTVCQVLMTIGTGLRAHVLGPPNHRDLGVLRLALSLLHGGTSTQRY